MGFENYQTYQRDWKMDILSLQESMQSSSSQDEYLYLNSAGDIVDEPSQDMRTLESFLIIFHEHPEYLKAYLPLLTTEDVRAEAMKIEALQLLQHTSCTLDDILRKALPKAVPLLRGPIGYDREKTRALFQELLALFPTGHFSEKFTDETSSMIVGSCDDIVFKVYETNAIAEKEINLLRLFERTRLANRIQRLPVLSTNAKQTLKNRLKTTAIGYDEAIFRLEKCGLLSLGHYTVVLSEKEEMGAMYGIDITSGRTKALPVSLRHQKIGTLATEDYARAEISLSCELHDEHIQEYLGRIIGVDWLRRDQIFERMVTLALLHSMKGNLPWIPVGYDDKEITDENERGILLRLERHFDGVVDIPESVLQKYIAASKRQTHVFSQRSSSLVLTHGDAKFDNWLLNSGVLADFGSAKYSTEYKDIAKALMLLPYPYVATMSAMNQNIQENEKYKEVVREHLLTLGTHFSEKKALKLRHFQAVLDDSNCNLYRAVSPKENMRPFVEGLFKEAIQMYKLCRAYNKRPVVASDKYFLRNMYDALLTESIRTLWYKSHTKPDLASRLVHVATNAAERIV